MANSHDSGHHAHDHGEGNYGHISVATYWKVFWSLMGLMILTVVAWYVEKQILPGVIPGWLAISIAMGIAMAKTLLIVVFFMHVKVSSKITQIFAAGSFVWLLILFIITMGDYVARGWPPGSGPLS